MTYIDGFVIAVPTANRQAFIDHARKADSIILELGALRVVECWGEEVPNGETTDFPRAVQATSDETVCFSWIEWPDKDARNAGMKAFMEDPRMQEVRDMPFDGKRMIYGGFVPVVTLEA